MNELQYIIHLMCSQMHVNQAMQKYELDICNFGNLSKAILGTKDFIQKFHLL